jgi:hypothetical protein
MAVSSAITPALPNTMAIAYIFLCPHERSNTKPPVTIHQPENDVPSMCLPLWRRATGSLPYQPGIEVGVNISIRMNVP